MSFDKCFSEKNDIHLLLVGLPSELSAEVRSLTSFKKGGITLIESIIGDDELRLTYNSMDCFLHFSSIGESFGMVLAEAQLCEIPVITVSTPKADNSQLEVLVHGETSVIVKNPQDLSLVMRDVKEGHYPLKEFGKKGRKHILVNFIPQALVPKLNILFTILLDKNNMRKNISEHFKSNIRPLSIDHLKSRGHGHYPPSTRLFMLMPKSYLKLADFASSMKKKLARLHA